MPFRFPDKKSKNQNEVFFVSGKVFRLCFIWKHHRQAEREREKKRQNIETNIVYKILTKISKFC